MERRPTPYDDLSREQLIELVVERDATIAALNARVAALEEQVRRLLERLGAPPTPDNSGIPPSQGRKANRPDRAPQPASPTR